MTRVAQLARLARSPLAGPPNQSNRATRLYRNPLEMLDEGQPCQGAVAGHRTCQPDPPPPPIRPASNRPPAGPIRSGTHWRTARRALLAFDPMCRECRQKPATHVEFAGGDAVDLSEVIASLTPLCAPCRAARASPRGECVSPTSVPRESTRALIGHPPPPGGAVKSLQPEGTDTAGGGDGEMGTGSKVEATHGRNTR